MGKLGSGKSGAGRFGAAAGLILWAAAGLAECPPGAVELRGASGVMRFSVEVADDEAERAVGLMNRPRLASSAGMLFAYERPRHAWFWMKNTLIPLDMIFADATGRVTRVHAGAKPLDETSIDGGDGVSFVLEINGGLAGRLGITEGSVMRTAVIDPATAVWACTE